MDINKENVCNVIIRIKKEIEPHLVKNDLVSTGILDSLDIMNLIMELESAFEIEIDPEDVLSENFESVEAIMSLVQKCKKQNS